MNIFYFPKTEGGAGDPNEKALVEKRHESKREGGKNTYNTIPGRDFYPFIWC